MDDFDAYRLMLFLHVAAVIVALGATVVFPILEAMARRSGLAASRFALQVIARVDTVIVFPGLIIAPLLGVGLIFSDITGFSDDFPAWLMLAITLYIVFVVGGLVVQHIAVMQGRELLDGYTADGPLPDAYQRIAMRIQSSNGIAGLAIIVVAFLMTWKPTLWD